MSRYCVVFAVLLTSCAPKTPQQVLYNQPPWRELKLAVEVQHGRYIGWGAPIVGGRVLTVRHLGGGAPEAVWRLKEQRGPMALIWDDDETDMAVYRLESPANLSILYPSKASPLLGEEVYWNVHTWSGNVGLGRGWIIGWEDNYYTVSGWFHPGTSGSPVLRSDGTLIGLATGGSNWSCGAPWRIFLSMDLDMQLECLFRRGAFPPEMVVGKIKGVF